MCGCTLYDSSTCGHSWVSMSQPCGYLSDLLNCPYRQTYQTLVAPPYTCPTCHGGFADRETIEMVQGPWGCNQLIRSQVGGSYVIPGQWGHAPTTCGSWGEPALSSGAMVPMYGCRYNHRLIGPCPCSPHMMRDCPMVCNGYDDVDDRLIYDCKFGERQRQRRRRQQSSRYHEYRYSSKPATNCTVM
jgi:hypothetical protein